MPHQEPKTYYRIDDTARQIVRFREQGYWHQQSQAFGFNLSLCLINASCLLPEPINAVSKLLDNIKEVCAYGKNLLVKHPPRVAHNHQEYFGSKFLQHYSVGMKALYCEHHFDQFTHLVFDTEMDLFRDGNVLCLVDRFSANLQDKVLKQDCDFGSINDYASGICQGDISTFSNDAMLFVKFCRQDKKLEAAHKRQSNDDSLAGSYLWYINYINRKMATEFALKNNISTIVNVRSKEKELIGWAAANDVSTVTEKRDNLRCSPIMSPLQDPINLYNSLQYATFLQNGDKKRAVFGYTQTLKFMQSYLDLITTYKDKNSLDTSERKIYKIPLTKSPSAISI